MPSKYEKISGWFDFHLLYDRMVDEAPDGSIFAEIGSWKGKSGCYLLEKIQESGKDITVYFIDTWTGNEYGEPHSSENYGKMAPEFVNNMHDAGFKVDMFDVFGDQTEPLHGILMPTDSIRASTWFHDKDLFFVFLDGYHSYPYTKEEIIAWLPKVKDGGYLGGHDFPADAISRAVRETIGEVEAISNFYEPHIKASYLYKKA
jgi:Methyltransferase domain